MDSVTDSLIQNPFHYSLPALLKTVQRDLFDRQYDPTSSQYLSVVERKCEKQELKKKKSVGKPNDPREEPVTEQKELVFVLVAAGIPHLYTVLSLLPLVCA